MALNDTNVRSLRETLFERVLFLSYKVKNITIIINNEDCIDYLIKTEGNLEFPLEHKLVGFISHFSIDISCYDIVIERRG